LSAQDYDTITQNPAFQRILRQAVTEWNGATNTSKRVKLKSQWAIEEGLPYVFQSMTDINEPLSARVEAFKAISRIGQLDSHEQIHGADRTFKLEINIGMGVPTVTIDSAPTIEHEPIMSDFEVDNEQDYRPGNFISADLLALDEE
jgi:hypothetical protein